MRRHMRKHSGPLMISRWRRPQLVAMFYRLAPACLAIMMFWPGAERAWRRRAGGYGWMSLAEASIGRDVLQARAGLLGNYDVLAEAEEAMENAASRIRLHVEAENLDPKPVEALAAAVGQYEDLIEHFKTGNSLLQNSLSYVGRLSTDPAFGALGDQFAPSATALAAAVLHLARDSSSESAESLQQPINRFEAQAPTGGLEGEAAHALLAHARLLSDLMPAVDQTLRALVAAPSRQPIAETRELLARAQAAFEVKAQRFRILLY